ncbi:Acyl-CoA dehydrogenase/oxidase [Penicillium coprophilum]|uniref:Acyl-CoA dehydrogenase/oxidase n=1 Tax=Penicillium coprophilum TaxID=36646 RepID=UPI0023A6EBF0|nr:Acyl-CoA dehydrogenase/oxidase [Penicillium coprophilum]KAJ5158873.1 Acyl-CoA dehydrogenase/oxidase [Penicillium coprophilum]
MSSPTLELLRLPMFKVTPGDSVDSEKVHLTYRRAAAIVKAYGMTLVDVLQCTEKFWKFHLDLIGTVDFAALTLMTIQLNLAAGTLSPFAEKQPQYRELLDKILKFEISAQYMVAEVGHGVDARNLETTATMLPTGEFDLHTPSPNGSKIMPPSFPLKGFPRVAMVFAQLVVSGENRGIRPFITWLNDGNEMFEGVTSKLLPRRAASKPLDHAITSFNHVRLPHSALLGTLDKPKDMRKHFLSTIWRIAVGTLGLTLTMVPVMKRCVYVAGKYSQRRHILGPDQKPKPIISFRTQHAPILHGLAQIFVFEAYAQKSIQHFQDPNLTDPVQHAVAASLKVVLSKACQTCLFNLSERCGAQGLTSELLLNRYKMPPPKNPTSYLAKHEQGLLDELRRMSKSNSGGHRGEEFDRLILPRSQDFVHAIGCRIAYEAAIEAKVDTDLVALYEIGVMLQDQSWFVQNATLTREHMYQMEAKRLSAVLPRLDKLLDETGAGPYCTAPIISQTSWDQFVDQLETKTGNGKTNIGLSSGWAKL